MDEDIHLPTQQEYPLGYSLLERLQKQCAQVQELLAAKPDEYTTKMLQCSNEEFNIIVDKKECIVVPKALQKLAIEWYHTTLQHPGKTRMYLTISQHYWWPKMKAQIEKHCQRCKECALTKKSQKQYGLLPAKETVEITPWKTLCIDLIGPYTIGPVNKKKQHLCATLHCLTMIDPATGWFEIVEIDDKKADNIANMLEIHWLTRYPRPEEVVLDRGREFMKEVVSLFQDEWGIKRKPITTRNPQANSIVERTHATIHNMIRTMGLVDKTSLNPDYGWQGILAAVRHAMNSTVHTTTRATPGQLVFGRDMLVNATFQANWVYIKDRKLRLIIQNNKKENAKRIPHNYQVGDRVKVKQMKSRKHGWTEYIGPFNITDVYDNGTVRLRKDLPSGNRTYETWNIRNIAPFHSEA